MNDVSLLFQTQKFPTGFLVPLCIQYLKLQLTVDEYEDVKFLVDFKESFSAALEEYMVKPVFNQCNNFLKSALFHPGIAVVLPSFVSSEVLESCWDSIREDAQSLSNISRNLSDAEIEEDPAQFFIIPSISAYRKFIKSVQVTDKLDLSSLQDSGKFNGVNPMEFWKSVVDKKHRLAMELAYLVPTAAMLLSLPAGEAIDESTFSSTGRTLTKDRASLNANTIELITVIRMFIDRFGISLNDFNEWVLQAILQKNSEDKAQVSQ